jgi:hypothetical protein
LLTILPFLLQPENKIVTREKRRRRGQKESEEKCRKIIPNMSWQKRLRGPSTKVEMTQLEGELRKLLWKAMPENYPS